MKDGAKKFLAALSCNNTPINSKHHKGIGSSLPVQNDDKSLYL